MDTLVDILRMYILSSLPQLYIYNLFIFSFVHPRPNRLHTKLILFAVIHSLFTDGVAYWIPYHWHLVNVLVVYTFLMIILFRDIGYKKLFLVYVSASIFSILMDLIAATAAIYLVGISSRENLIQSNYYEALLILYPQLLITLVAGWYVRNRTRLNMKRFLSSLIEGHRSQLIKLFSFIVLQFFLIAMTLFMQLSDDPQKSKISIIFIYLTVAVSLCALFVILRLFFIAKTDAIRSTQALYVDDINNMFTSVRGQRHDFLNHVQVIHAMAQMGKIEQLQEYTKTLVHETREVSDIVNHASPALAAFAQAKTTVALGRGIAFGCQLPERWNVPDTAVNMLDLIKILGNLVDNAFDETFLLPPEQRSVYVTIERTDDALLLEVTNRGQPINEETRSRIFQAGYSTKGESHSGLGLAIVQERVLHYGGTIEVRSDDAVGTTTFVVRIPINIRLTT